MSWQTKWADGSGQGTDERVHTPFTDRKPERTRIVGSGGGGNFTRSSAVGAPNVASVVRALKTPRKSMLVALAGTLCLLLGVAVLATLASYDPVRAMERIETQEDAIDGQISTDEEALAKIESVQAQLKEMRDDPTASASQRANVQYEVNQLGKDEAKIRTDIARQRKKKKTTQTKLKQVVKEVKRAKKRAGAGATCITGNCAVPNSRILNANCASSGKAGLTNIKSRAECQRMCQKARDCKVRVCVPSGCAERGRARGRCRAAASHVHARTLEEESRAARGRMSKRRGGGARCSAHASPDSHTRRPSVALALALALAHSLARSPHLLPATVLASSPRRHPPPRVRTHAPPPSLSSSSSSTRASGAAS